MTPEASCMTMSTDPLSQKCKVCGKTIRTMCFLGTGVCCGLCLDIVTASASAPQEHQSSGKRIAQRDATS